MLKRVLVVIAGILIILTGVILRQPDEYRVTRSTGIAAPASAIYPLINDFHNWDKWSPWAKLDPNMKTTHEGSPSGMGSVYTWTGNDDVGEGKMTIVESVPNERVRIHLEFLRPFESASTNEFVLKPAGDRVDVDWSMTGRNNFMSKAFSLFMGGMDKAIGPDFEKGLAQMKSVAEAGK